MQATDAEKITKRVKQTDHMQSQSIMQGKNENKYRIPDINKGPKTTGNQHCFNIIIKSP